MRFLRDGVGHGYIVVVTGSTLCLLEGCHSFICFLHVYQHHRHHHQLRHRHHHHHGVGQSVATSWQLRGLHDNYGVDVAVTELSTWRLPNGCHVLYSLMVTETPKWPQPDNALIEVRRHTPWSRVRCHGCWLTHSQFHSQFHSRRHSLRITLKYTTLMRMRGSYAWTMKPWQRSEWRLGFNSVLVF